MTSPTKSKTPQTFLIETTWRSAPFKGSNSSLAISGGELWSNKCLASADLEGLIHYKVWFCVLCKKTCYERLMNHGL